MYVGVHVHVLIDVACRELIPEDISRVAFTIHQMTC